MTNKPVKTFKGGRAISASIFKNEKDGKVWYITDIKRTFKNSDGKFEDIRSWDETELLVVQQLTRRCHDYIRDVRDVAEQPTQMAA